MYLFTRVCLYLSFRCETFKHPTTLKCDYGERPKTLKYNEGRLCDIRTMEPGGIRSGSESFSNLVVWGKEWIGLVRKPFALFYVIGTQ